MSNQFDSAFAGLAGPALQAQFGEAANYYAPASATLTNCTATLDDAPFDGVTILDGAAWAERSRATLLLSGLGSVIPALGGRVIFSDPAGDWTIVETPHWRGGLWVCEAEAETAPRLNPSRKRHGS